MRRGAQIVVRGVATMAHSRSKISSSSPSARSPALAILASISPSSAVVKRTCPAKRLAMDEGRVQRRRHQLVAVLRGDLDEIAEHVVVADFEALDGGRLGVARLHRGDDEARGVAQIAGLVERGLIAFAHKAAVALDQRQLFGQRALEFARQFARRPAQRRHHGGDFRRRILKLRQSRQRGIGRQNAVAQSREVARAAASDRQSRQRARHVGRGAQRGADFVAHGGVGDEGGDRIEPPRDRGAVGERRGKPLRKQARSGCGHGAVDGVEQRAAPFAGQRPRQFEIGAGGRVDRHGGAGGLARRRRQRRALSDLGAVDIGDGGCGRRGLQPRHRAEAVHGGDREIIAQPPLGGGAVEDIAGQRRHRRQFAQQRSQLGIAIERVGDDDLIGIDPRQRRRQFAGRAFGDDEFGGGNVDPGQPDAVAPA